MVWVIGITAVILLVLMGVVLLVALRSRDDDPFQRGSGEFSDKYGRGFRNDTFRDSDPVRNPVAESVPENSQKAQEIVSFPNLRIGDYVEISGGVGGHSYIRFTVSGENRYQTDDGGWIEFFGKHRAQTVYLESFSDTQTEVGVVFSGATFSLEKTGVTEEDLALWDEDQATDNSFEYDGETWQFEFSGVVSCSSRGSGPEDSYYGWDFAGESGDRLLCVEKREDSPFEVCLVHLIDVNRIHATRD